jgi:hypothetical protein
MYQEIEYLELFSGMNNVRFGGGWGLGFTITHSSSLAVCHYRDRNRYCVIKWFIDCCAYCVVEDMG